MIVDLRPESAFLFFKEFVYKFFKMIDRSRFKYGYWISQQLKLLKRTSS